MKDTSVGILGKKFEKDKAPLWAKHVRSIKINHITYIPFDFYISDVCKKCKNLEKLFIARDYRIINNTSLKDIAKNCKLKELTLQYNLNIKPKTIKEIPKLCPTLKELLIQHCRQLQSNELYDSLKQDYPHLECF